MATKTVILKKDFRPIIIPGKHHRLLCLNGQNKGFSYYLKSGRIILGRSKRVDIQVLDSQSSRHHAELTRVGECYVLTDLGSQNGVFIEDDKIVQHELKDGDRILIGKTAFKYNIIINKESNIIDDEEVETEDLKEKPKVTKKDNKKKIIIGIILILTFLLLDDETEDTKSKKKKNIKKGTDEISSLLKKKGQKKDKDLENRVDVIIKRGLREYREENYFRSIAEFNYALILSPNHTRASFYLNRAKQDLDAEINLNFYRSKRAMDALKFGEAIVANCEVRKFLKGYELDDRYKEAVANLDKIKIKLNKDQKLDLCGAKR